VSIKGLTRCYKTTVFFKHLLFLVITESWNTVTATSEKTDDYTFINYSSVNKNWGVLCYYY